MILCSSRPVSVDVVVVGRGVFFNACHLIDVALEIVLQDKGKPSTAVSRWSITRTARIIPTNEGSPIMIAPGNGIISRPLLVPAHITHIQTWADWPIVHNGCEVFIKPCLIFDRGGNRQFHLD